MSVTETQKSISQAGVLWNEFGQVSSYGKIHLGNLCLHRASWNFAMHMNILKAFFFNWCKALREKGRFLALPQGWK